MGGYGGGIWNISKNKMNPNSIQGFLEEGNLRTAESANSAHVGKIEFDDRFLRKKQALQDLSEDNVMKGRSQVFDAIRELYGKDAEQMIYILKQHLGNV